jgi:quercetin dioxygenase-like cupin family protein
VESLDSVPHHTSIPEIQRLVFPGVPYLASVHCVTAASAEERDYCEPHDHHDEHELNLFLGTSDDFRFEVTLDGADQIVGPTAALYIPAGQKHAANVVSGSGYYVVLKVPVVDR